MESCPLSSALVPSDSCKIHHWRGTFTHCSVWGNHGELTYLTHRPYGEAARLTSFLFLLSIPTLSLFIYLNIYKSNLCVPSPRPLLRRLGKTGNPSEMCFSAGALL